MRTKALATAVSGVLAISAGMAVAMPGVSYADTVPAPTSEADAVAVRVDPLLRFSHTHATATSTTGSSKAAVVELSGTPLNIPQLNLFLGGSQSGNGTAKGSVLDTSTTALAPLVNLQVAPWRATVANTATKRHAESYAALLSLVLVNDKTLFVKVLQSSSTADHDDTTLTSTGSSVSDGAVVGVGSGSSTLLTVQVLHAEASSSNGGATWLLGINGTNIGTANGSCALNVAPLLNLVCLQVVGGKGANNSANDAVASVSNGSLVAGISNVSSQTGAGKAAPTPPPPPPPAPAPAPVVAAAQLPRTGVPSLALTVTGVLLVMLGFAVVAAARVRRLAAIVA